LAIYFTSKLGFDEDKSTQMLHAFAATAYFTPAVGAWLADEHLGKFKLVLT
jgi:dipeptide/tripeptide permease